MAKIVVGCKLPNGLEIQVGEQTIKLNGFMKGSLVVGGFGITEDVDEDLFNAWLNDNQDLTIVKKELIFKHKSLSNAKAKAKEGEKNKSGLEQIDPKEVKEVEKLSQD